MLVAGVPQIGLESEDLLRVTSMISLEDGTFCSPSRARPRAAEPWASYWRPIELKQRLPLLDRDVRLDHHRRDQRRLGQARDQLDRVLDHLGVGRIRRDKPQADHEDQEQMRLRTGPRRRPKRMLNFSHLNLKKTSHTSSKAEQQDKGGNHRAVPFCPREKRRGGSVLIMISVSLGGMRVGGGRLRVSRLRVLRRRVLGLPVSRISSE